MKLINGNDLIARLKANYPDESLNGEFLAPSVALAHKLISCHTVYNEEHESSTTIFAFNPETTDEEIRNIAKMCNFDPDGHSCNCAHDCCGHWFYGAIRIVNNDNHPAFVRFAYIYGHRNV